MKLSDKVAIVTGAGSGIGRALALQLADKHCHLALADIDAAGLAETRSMLQNTGVRVSQHVLDVSDRPAVRALPEQVLQIHGQVDLLFNNAGVALGGNFLQLREEDFDWLLDINFHGLVSMTRVFLPLLLERPEARIINISSIFGIIAPPGQTAYAASKFAVRGFSHALRHELANSSVGVTVVHPGGVATAIARNARVAESGTQEEQAARLALQEKLLRMPPQRAAAMIISGVEKKKVRIFIGTDARLMAWLEWLSPLSYWQFIRKIASSIEKAT